MNLEESDELRLCCTDFRESELLQELTFHDGDGEGGDELDVICDLVSGSGEFDVLQDVGVHLAKEEEEAAAATAAAEKCKEEAVAGFERMMKNEEDGGETSGVWETGDDGSGMVSAGCWTKTKAEARDGVGASSSSSSRGATRLGPKLRYSEGASASHYCHICGRASNTAQLAACANVRIGLCRKTLCEKCLLVHQGELFHWAKMKGSTWTCTHCRGVCPQRARCHQYQRNNMRRRLKKGESGGVAKKGIEKGGRGEGFCRVPMKQCGDAGVVVVVVDDGKADEGDISPAGVAEMSAEGVFGERR